MILRSIEVSGWQCYAERVAVGPFTEGLNIVHAPNGIGKTTLFRALQHGLLDFHGVTGQDAEKLRPFGRSLPPTVAIEFSHGGKTYRLSKRFLDRPSSKVERQEGGRFVLLHEDDSADNFVRSLLAGTTPGKGMAKQAHWGLAQVLWGPQHDFFLRSLSDDTVGRIRESLGFEVVGEKGDVIEEAIRKAFDVYFTRGGSPRTGKESPSPVVQAEKGLAEAKRLLALAKEEHKAFEAASLKVLDVKAKGEAAKAQVVELYGQVMRLGEQCTEYKRIDSELQVKTAEQKAAEEGFLRVRDELAEICRLNAEVAGAEKTLKDLDAELLDLVRCAEDASGRLRTAHEAAEAVRSLRGKIDGLQTEAEQALALHVLSETLDRHRVTLNRVQKVMEELHKAQDARAKAVIPEVQDIKAIRKSHRALEEARVRLEAGLVRLEIQPDKDATASVVAGESPGNRKLGAGRPFEATGCPEVVIQVSGFGKISARGGTASAPELKEQHDQVKAEFGRLLRPYGLSDLDGIEHLQEEGRRLDEKVKDAQTKLDSLLEGGDLETLRKAIAKAEAEIEGILKDHSAWRKIAPDPAALKNQAKQDLRAFEKAIDDAERVKDKVQGEQVAAEKRLAERKATHTSLGQGVRERRQRLSELRADGRSQEARQRAVDQAALAYQSLQGAVRALRADLEAYGGDPRKSREILERQLAEASKDERKVWEEEKGAELNLQSRIDKGTYAHLAACEEACRSQEEALSRQEVRAKALKLLQETLDRCKTDAVSAVVGPVQTLVSQNYRRIAGRDSNVRLGGSFLPSGVLLEGEELPLDQVSMGEEEQVHLATRLALAEVLSQGERQLVVLDDALAATDMVRMSRALLLIQEVSERLQVIVLTCHKERFGGVKANFIDLEEMIRKGYSPSVSSPRQETASGEGAI